MKVNDHVELERKGKELIKILLGNFQERSGNEVATSRDMMPECPINCFSGNYVEATHLSKTSQIAEMVPI